MYRYASLNESKQLFIYMYVCMSWAGVAVADKVAGVGHLQNSGFRVQNVSLQFAWDGEGGLLLPRHVELGRLRGKEW